MMRRLSRIGLGIAAIGAVSVLLLGLYGAWRLSQGPVSLGVLKPYLEERLAVLGLPYRMAFSDLVLNWGGTERPLDLVISDAELRGEDERAVARISEISMGLSLRALLGGDLVVKTIRLADADVTAIRRKDGTLSIGLAGDGGESLELFESGNGGRSGNSLLGKLDRIAIHRASVSLDDRLLGLKMSPERVSIDLERTEHAVVGVFDIDSWSGDERLSLGGTAEYRLNDRTSHVALDFRGLDPSRLAPVLAGWFPHLPDPAGIALPLQGRLEASSNPDGGLRKASFAVRGGTGSLSPAALDGHRYDIRSLTFDGSYSGADGAVAIDRLDIDFGLPTLSVTGKIAGIGKTPRLRARARLEGMTMSALGRYWPKGIAKGARRWLSANLNQGDVRDVDARLVASFPPAGARIERVDVTLGLDRATVHYLKPLPPVTHAKGTVTIDRDRVQIAVEEGRVDDLRIASGRIDIAGLSVDRAHLTLETRVSGPVATALSVLDHPRLRYASKVGLVPGQVRGTLSTRIQGSFPLIDALALEDTALNATGTLDAAAADGVFLGQDLTAGALRFALDTKGMKIEGDARLSGIAAAVGWQEDFTGTAETLRRYTVGARLTEPERKRFGVSLGPAVKGPLSVDAAYEVSSDRTERVAGTLDTTEAELALAPLEWWKPPGVAGRAAFEIAVENGEASAIRIASLAAGDLRAAGRLSLDRGRIRRIEIDNFSVPGRFDIAGMLTRDEASGWTVDTRGQLFDAAPLQRLIEGETGASLPPLRIAARFGRAKLTEGRTIRDMSLIADRRADGWRAIDLAGSFGNGKRFDLSYRPGESGGQFRIESEDAGEIFGLVGDTRWVRGGRVAMSAKRGTGDETGLWKGELVLRDFVLTGAPRLVEALRVASLGSLSEELGGRGVGVQKLTVPFDYDGSTIRISEGRVFGTGFGATGHGTIDVDEETLKIDGTLIPAYQLNAALGELPGIGILFSGEKHGGLFAAPYAIRGKIEKPSFSVNPLGVLTPGVFRNIFRIFDAEREELPPKPPLTE